MPGDSKYERRLWKARFVLMAVALGGAGLFYAFKYLLGH